MTLPKLYHGHMVVPEWNGSPNVLVVVLRADRSEPVADYATAIEGWDALDGSDRIYPTTCLDEMLTASEGEAVRKYMADLYGYEVTLEEQPLPIPANAMGLTMVPCSRQQGLIDFLADDGCHMPFQMVGYYDIRQEEE